MASSALQLILAQSVKPRNGSPKQIIRFASRSAYLSFIRAWKDARRESVKRASIRALPMLHSISCALPDLKALRSCRSVIGVEADTRMTVHAIAEAQEASYAGTSSLFVPWGIKHIGAPSAWKKSTGRGVRIGVIDTGADYSHPDLRYSLAGGVNLIKRGALPADDNGHGTHIAGTIAAFSQTAGMIGVAPHAVIHPVKAFDHNGSAYVSDIIRAIEWCIRNRMDIINMSFGMKTSSTSLLEAIKAARRAGIVVVASSGNDGNPSEIDFPARSPYTISVGATSRGRKVAPFSNRGRHVDIYAPGDKVISTWMNGRYKELSGTSMATSHVTGVIAMMLALKRRMKPLEIKRTLRAGTLPVTLRGKLVKSKGELHAGKAIRSAAK